MSDTTRDTLLDCMSQLWTLARKSEDYWQHVACLEWEESLCFFGTLSKNSEQLSELFGTLSDEDTKKILNTFQALIKRARSQTPGFFEIALWAAVIEAKSQSLRREVYKVALEIDLLSRRMIGAANEVTAEEMDHYLALTKKFVTLSKHLHPAFSHSDASAALKRIAA